MNIQNARYSKDNEQIIAVIDGKEVTAPAISGNRFYNEIMRQVAEESLVIADYVAPPTQPYTISKYTIITRIQAAGKFEAALAVLKSDDLLYEKWSSVAVIMSNDQPARDLFAAVGLDPDVILAEGA